jgi:lipopolysaccharide transport system permease protein
MGSPTTVCIEPGRAESRYWRDVWEYRELLYFLAWRDVLVRYKQTAIGVAWALVRPLLMLAVFSIVFGRLANLPSDGVPYPLLVFSALLPWQFFSSTLSDTSASLVSNSSLLTKVYFPRLLAPLSAIAVSVVDALVSGVLLAGLMAWHQYPVNPRVIWLPAFAMLGVLLALGCGLWLSALNVRYRDVRHLVPFLTQIGLYASPIGFSSSVVPDRYRLLYSLNPMVGVIDGFRYSLLGGNLYAPAIWVSVTSTALLLVSGLAYFRRTERTFADVV